MAVLDYAFLADYARVEGNGTLTVIGASWTFLSAPILPTAHRIAVAGRVRGLIGEDPIDLRIDVRGPSDSFSLAAGATLMQGPHSRPYGDGFIGHLFAFDLQLPLPRPGLYGIDVLINQEHARHLAFEVALVDNVS